MKHLKALACLAIAFSATALVGAQAGEQLLNLPPPPKGGRFVTPQDLVWPEKPGEADICLWADDKFAACCITIDDNCQPDHAWWLKLADELGIRLTWFVITDNVVKNAGRKGTFQGCWEEWQALADAGHSIQSHTTNHRSDPPEKNRTPDTTLLTEAELSAMYRDSLAVINANITNNVACCIAYPSGDAHPDVLAKHAIAARGVYGVPSCANAINYLCTNKGSGDPAYTDIVLEGATDRGPTWLRSKKELKRGLNIVLYHLVHAGRSDEERAKNAAQAEAEVRHVASQKDRLWVDTFDRVMKYGQERDSATLSVLENTPRKIVLEVKDRMDDTFFDFPLTVKVRLPDAWTSVKSTQDGKPVKTRIVEHADARFALVPVVPDRGEVVLAP
ncbi:MAG: polysaccharide deacetylase family protein [Kiritimatiellia bacterium]|jgi:hypothetical protein